jgi:hypothetical protein
LIQALPPTDRTAPARFLRDTRHFMMRFRNVLTLLRTTFLGARAFADAPARAMASKDLALALLLGISILTPRALAADQQQCAPADLAPVDAWLAKHPWRVGKTSPDALVTAACKRSPADANVLIVAAAYVQDEDDKNEIVALVDRTARAVRATFTSTISEDTITRVGSFRIDTAHYELAPGVRAFGVDFSSVGQSSGAADFVSSGPERTLFVQHGTTLTPVLSGFSLTTWHSVPGREHRGEVSNWTIAIGTTRSHGLFDLLVTRTTEPDEDGTPALRERSVLHFDGKSYRHANPGESDPLGPRPAASAPTPP